MHQARTLTVLKTLPALATVVMLIVCKVASAGATLVFSYPNGFANQNQFNAAWEAHLVGSTMTLTYAPDGTHRGGSAWYNVQQNIQSFTTDFTFQEQFGATGMSFVIQNSNSTTNNNYGLYAIGDANGDGYGAYSFQPKSAIANSVAVVFDLGAYGSNTAANRTGISLATLELNGGPYVDSGQNAVNDLQPYGVFVSAGHVMAAHLVYDGTILTMVLRDTVTNAQARFSWPVNIPAATLGNNAWLGFSAGTVNAATQSVLSWDFYNGYAQRLATPTFGTAPGSYPSTQNVTISGPAGATIYYTTNGLQPTSASTPYTGPISVGSSEVIQAVAIEPGYTDSYVASANYEIAPTGSPSPIYFPAGFSAGDGVVLAGVAKLNGSAIQLTDTNTLGNEVGAAWYAVPVNVQSFSTSFTLQNSAAAANGMAFVIQNQLPASLDGTANSTVSGGNTALGFNTLDGFAGLTSSVAVKFDLYNGNSTGLYLNGTSNSISGQVGISAIALNSGHPISVALTYDGTTLSMRMTDTVTAATFTQNWALNIPSVVGGNTAYVGFTGSTGGLYANQSVVSWTYNAASSQPVAAAVPAAPTHLTVQ